MHGNLVMYMYGSQSLSPKVFNFTGCIFLELALKKRFTACLFLLYELVLLYSVMGVKVQLDVKTWFVQDQLKGDNVTEIRVKFVKRLEDAVPAGED